MVLLSIDSWSKVIATGGRFAWKIINVLEQVYFNVFIIIR